MADVFELKGKIVIDNSDANDDLDETIKKAKDVGDAIEEAGSNAGTAGPKVEGMISTGSLARAQAFGQAMYDVAVNTGKLIMDLGGKSIEAAAKIEAENAQFASTFGDVANAATDSFNAIQKDTNVYAGRLKSVGIKAYGQFKGSGLDAADSLVMMDEYLRLAADAAAYYDISLEDADTRLRSFLRGNTEAGDAIGLFTSESQRNSYALEKYGKEWQKLTEAQRQMLLLDVAGDIYAQSGAMGQASREGSTWANVMGNLSRVWEEILAKLGGPIIEQLIPRIEAFSQWLSENPELVDQFAESIGNLLGTALDGLQTLIETFGAVGIDWGNQRKANEERAATKAGQQELTQENMGIAQGLAGKYGSWSSDKSRAAYSYAVALTNNTGIDKAKKNLELAVTPEEMQAVTADIETLFKTYQDPLEVTSLMFSDNAEAEFQEMVRNIPLTARVNIIPGPLSFLGNLFGGGSSDKGYANGLDRVPYNGYRAVLHKNEAVLTAREADSWRSGAGRVDTSRLEGIMQEVLVGIHDISRNTGAGHSVVLDSGVMVGQLTPGINMQLGTMSKRRGRS